ncbi:MAG: lactate racemase domain-containing protein [Proteobacteria bacterium]|nr:lactate racemase domain-containing protein [Pseudomonadota bacterium]
MRIELPYGPTPLVVEVDDRARVLAAPMPPPPRPLRGLLDDALDAPIGAGALTAGRGSRVTVIVSDATRDEPRRAMLDAIARRLPAQVRLTIAVATGTHGRADLAALDLPSGMTIVNHDGHDPTDLVDLGVTTRGTPIRVHRCVVDADLVVATGCILPHYFAGFSAGAKAIFPGLGEARAIRSNHAHKAHLRARAGIVDGNPVRADLEEAVRAIATPMFLLNGVVDADHQIQAVVAGDLVHAHRVGCALARPWFTVRSPRASAVIASDGLPVTASLYQAAKIAAACAPLVSAGGLLVIAAACPDGIGPLDVVNEAIFQIGILPRLAANVRLALASSLSEDIVRQTLLAPIAPIALSTLTGSLLVIPRASQLLFEVDSL